MCVWEEGGAAAAAAAAGGAGAAADLHLVECHVADVLGGHVYAANLAVQVVPRHVLDLRLPPAVQRSQDRHIAYHSPNNERSC